MGYTTRKITLASTGEGTITVGPMRLAAFDGDGSVSLSNRGHTWTEQDFDHPDEPFVVGKIVATGGTPDGEVRAYFRF